MFTPFAFIKRQVSAAIAAIGQRLLLIGNFTTFNTTVGINAAKLINGSSEIDPTFNVGSGANSSILNSEFDQNGKLLLGGSFTSYSGSAVNRIVRVNADGTIDPSLNVGTGANGSVYITLPLQSGKILVGGGFNQYSGSLTNNLIRINSNGTLDSTFTSVPLNSPALTAVTQSDGKIIIGGSFGGNTTATRLNKTTSTNLIDISFNEGSGPNDNVYALTQQSDGKIIIGGQFSTYSGSTANYVARINTNGTLDTTFTSSPGGGVFTILPVSESKILVGGFTFYRYNSNATLDTTFNTVTGHNGVVYQAVTQSDNKIIVVGSFTSFGQGLNLIVKITPSGPLDYSFNQGLGPNSSVYTAVTQSDGKIIIGGQFTTYSGSASNRLARVNTDGSRDDSFNVGVGFNGDVFVAKVQPDGKILVGGSFTSYSGSASQNRIIRLNSNGTRDTTFNQGTGASSTVYDLQLQSDNKIIAVGAFSTTYSGSTSPRIVRINTDGTKDFTFNMGTTGFSANQYSAQIQADGKIIVVGTNATYSGSAAQRIRRINTNGTLDTTFNIGTAGLNNTAYRAAIQPDQKIVVLGAFSSYSGSAVNRLTRINTNGTRDTSLNVGTGFNVVTAVPGALELDSSGNIYAGSNFTTYSGSTVDYFVKINPSGSIITGSHGFTSTVNTLLVDSTGSIYAGTQGGYTNANRIARLNANGTLDPTFNTGVGFNTLSGIQYTVGIQDDGKIIVGGSVSTYSGSAAARIRRLNTDGTNDTSFNQGTGFNITNVVRVKIQPDQKILAIGGFTSYSGSTANRIARLNTNGTLDTTFNPGTGFDSVTAIPSALELDSSGSIYVGSDFLTYSGSTVNYFVKISPSGSIITGSTLFNGYDGTVRALLIDSTGSIYAGGSFTGYVFTKNCIIRLDENGEVDDSFNTGTGFNSSVYSLQAQSDNKIVAGGLFNSYAGSSNNYIVRLNSNGTKDTSFNIGTGFSNAVYTTQLQNDGKILVGGAWDNYYSGSNSAKIARLNTNGTLDTTFNITASNNSTVTKLLVDNSGSIHIIQSGYFKRSASGSIGTNGVSTSGSGVVNSLAKDSSNNIFILGSSPFTVSKNTNLGIVAFESSLNNTSSLFNPGLGFYNFNTGTKTIPSSVSLKNTSGDIWLNSSQYPQYYSGSSFSSDLFKISQQGNLLATSSLTTNTVQTITKQLDGKLLVGQSSGYPGWGVWRFNSNGSYDNTFSVPYLWSTVYSIQVQSTGKILVGGNFYSNELVGYDDGDGGFNYYDTPVDPRYLLRLNSNGGVDGTFPVNQVNAADAATVYSINTLPDDSSILTGGFTGYGANSSIYIVKINSEGIIDTTYNVGSGFGGTVFKSTLQPDGKLIAAGVFTTYSGSAVNRIARINTNGTLDTTFNPGSGFNTFNSENSKILVDDLGNIHVAGGGFTSYNGTAISGYVKILPNGNIDPTGTSGSFQPNQPTTIELLD